MQSDLKEYRKQKNIIAGLIVSNAASQSGGRKGWAQGLDFPAQAMHKWLKSLGMFWRKVYLL